MFLGLDMCVRGLGPHPSFLEYTHLGRAMGIV